MAKRSEGGALSQGELFAGRAAAVEVPAVTPELVRSRLHALLDELRAADHMPWPDRKARVKAVVFPQMADHLPLDEANALRTTFRRELDRLQFAEAE